MKRQPKTDSEHHQQVYLFQWAESARGQYPQLQFLYATPNGGMRNIVVATRLKREGVKRGVPDVFLPVPTAQYHGLYIEMKFGKNKMSPEQLVFKAYCEKVGYCFACCYYWVDAKDVIVKYLSLTEIK